MRESKLNDKETELTEREKVVKEKDEEIEETKNSLSEEREAVKRSQKELKRLIAEFRAGISENVRLASSIRDVTEREKLLAKNKINRNRFNNYGLSNLGGDFDKHNGNGGQSL